MEFADIVLAAGVVFGLERSYDLFSRIESELFEEIEVRLVEICAGRLEEV